MNDAVGVPPPGAGVLTDTWAVPADATSDEVMGTVNCVGLTTVVDLALPFHLTVVEGRKFVPSTVRVKAGAFAFVEDGTKAEIVGTGLLIVKDRALEVPPPGEGLLTATGSVPDVLRSEAGTIAVRAVGEVKVVVNAAPPHWTTEPCAKFDPETFNVVAAVPTFVEVGEIEESVGVG